MKMPIDFDLKGLSFVAEAIVVKIETLNAAQRAFGDNENLVADASNDKMYYQGLLQMIREKIEEIQPSV
jgi:hypothetical protein